MTIEIDSGMNIYSAAQKAVTLAASLKQQVGFYFNDIFVEASPESHAPDIAMIYNLRHEIRRLESRVQSLDFRSAWK